MEPSEFKYIFFIKWSIEGWHVFRKLFFTNFRWNKVTTSIYFEITLRTFNFFVTTVFKIKELSLVSQYANAFLCSPWLLGQKTVFFYTMFKTKSTKLILSSVYCKIQTDQGTNQNAPFASSSPVTELGFLCCYSLIKNSKLRLSCFQFLMTSGSITLHVRFIYNQWFQNFSFKRWACLIQLLSPDQNIAGLYILDAFFTQMHAVGYKNVIIVIIISFRVI